MSEFKTLLTESVQYLNASHGVDPRKDFAKIIADDVLFESYTRSLMEGLSPEDSAIIEQMLPTIRKHLLESNLAAQITPYQQLILPLLRVFFPRLVAKEAVTISPIDQPYVVKYFLKPIIKSFDGSVIGDVPVLDGDASAGLSVPASSDITLSGGVATENLISLAGANPDKTTLARQVTVTEVTLTDGTNDETVKVNVPIDPVNGTATVNATADIKGTKVSDTLIISVNFETGVVNVTSVNKKTKSVHIDAFISLEQNNYVPQVELKLDRIMIEAITRKLGVNWSIEAEQDYKALFDLDFQAQVVEIMGKQIATDIDKEIIGDLIAGVLHLNPKAQDTFSRTMPSGYAFGQLRAA